MLFWVHELANVFTSLLKAETISLTQHPGDSFSCESAHRLPPVSPMPSISFLSDLKYKLDSPRQRGAAD